MFSFQGKNNAELIGNLETALDVEFVSEELFQGTENDHKFKPGDTVELFGLEDYPQFDGEIVEITSYREDGRYGKAYYFETANDDLAANLNWTYEYRLRTPK